MSTQELMRVTVNFIKTKPWDAANLWVQMEYEVCQKVKCCGEDQLDWTQPKKTKWLKCTPGEQLESIFADDLKIEERMRKCLDEHAPSLPPE